MNFTDSALRESRQEFSYEEQCEVFINPRYYGNQCPDNLSGLKLKVHHVLNSRKENFEETQEKKLEEDIQSTKSFRGLIQIIKELKSPSVSIEKPPSRVISSYAYNQIRESFVFGFNNGEIGIGQISAIRTKVNIHMENCERRFMGLTRMTIDANQSIIGLYIEFNTLYILSSKHLFRTRMLSSTRVKRPTKLFNLSKLDALKKSEIYEIIFKPQHKKLYIMTLRDRWDLMYFVRIDLQEANVSETLTVKRDISLFEIDNLDGDQFYMVEDNYIYRSSFVTGQGFLNFAKKKTEIEDFYRTKEPIEFIRFQLDMENFLINDGKTIKLVDTVSHDVKAVFDGHSLVPLDAFFSKNNRFVFSVHDKGSILIWDVEKELLVTSIQSSIYKKSYSKPSLINEDKNLAVLHSQGVDLWQLESPEIRRKLDIIPGFAKMHFLKNGEQLMIQTDKRSFTWLEVDTCRELKKFDLPEGTICFQTLNDGNMIIGQRNRSYNAEKARRAKKRMITTYRNLESIPDIDYEFTSGVKSHRTRSRQMLRLKSDLNLVMENAMLPESQIKANRDGVMGENENLTSAFRLDTQSGKGEKIVNNGGKNTQQGTERFSGQSTRQKNRKVKRGLQVSIVLDDETDEKLPAVNQFGSRGRTSLASHYFTESELDNMVEYTTNEKELSRIKESTIQGEVSDKDFESYSKKESSITTNGKESVSKKSDKELMRLERKRESIFITIKNDGDPRRHEINEEIYEFRVALLVLEDFKKIGPDSYNGLYTIFQTDYPVVCLDVANSRSSPETKSGLSSREINQSAENRYKPTMKRLERSIGGTRAAEKGFPQHQALIGLDNNTVFRALYQTDRIGKPLYRSLLVEKIFKEVGSVSERKIDPEVQETDKMKGYLNFSYKKQVSDVIKYPEENICLKCVKQVEGLDLSLSVSTIEHSLNEKITLSLSSQVGKREFTQIQLVFDDHMKQNFSDKFELDVIDIKKPESKNGVVHLALQSSLLILTFQLYNKMEKIRFEGFFRRESRSPQRALFSPSRRLFYIVDADKIQIRDQSLKYFIHTVKAESEIDSLVLCDERGLMLVYSNGACKELDLDELRFRKVTNPNKGLKARRYLFDFERMNPDERFIMMFKGRASPEIQVLPFEEGLTLKAFPYESLIKCFLKKHYSRYIWDFARYYYARLKESDGKDLLYGPLNPLHFAIYHNDSQLLEDLLEKYSYPRRIYNYVSPLEFAFALNHRTNINVLCDSLLRRPDFVYFSRADFLHLLGSDIRNSHLLLASLPSTPAVNLLPKLLYMGSDVKTYFHDYATSLLVDIKKQEQAMFLKRKEEFDNAEETKEESQRKVISDRSVGFNSDRTMQISRSTMELDRQIEESAQKFVKREHNNTIFKSEVEVITVPFKFNYATGTEDSVEFLDSYSSSPCEDFILSDWKEIISEKWRRMKIPYFVYLAIFYAYIIFFTVSAVFVPESAEIRVVALVLNCFFFVWEIIQIIVYCSYKWQSYFRDFYNMVDWIMLLGSFIYLLVFQKDHEKDFNTLYCQVTLVMLYYRGFTFLRIVDAFTTLVGIINIIIGRLLIFFCVAIYLYLLVVIMIVRLDEPSNILGIIRDAYYWMMLGSIEGDAFEIKYSAVPIVFGSLVCTIILLNILIAYLSNLFSRLEEQEKIQALQERAELVLDLEIFVYFFNYILSGKIRLRRQHELERYRRMLQDSSSMRRLDSSQATRRRALSEYLAQEKFLYIFRRLNLQTPEEEQNVYQRVKQVEKGLSSLESMLKKRFRAQDMLIEELIGLMKANSSRHENTVDELKNVIDATTRQVVVNTEALLERENTSGKEIGKLAEMLNGVGVNVGKVYQIIKKIQ